MLDMKTLKEQEISALEKQYLELSKEIFDLNCELKITRKLGKPHLLKEKKKDRARVLTTISEKRRGY